MNCEIFCSRAREYLEDLLPAEVRREASRHYAECARCRNYALNLGTLASDFKKMLYAALPASMEKEILSEMRGGRKPVLKKTRPSSAASWAILALGILLIGIGFAAGDYFLKTNRMPGRFRFILPE